MPSSMIRMALMVGVAFSMCGCDLIRALESGTIDTDPRTEKRVLSPKEASVAVSMLLYEQNLISNREVNEKMNAAVLKMTENDASSDSVMPAFHRWLESWANAHPADVETARLRGGAYSVEAQKIYADADSTRRAQTDSIQQLVRERLRSRAQSVRVAFDRQHEGTATP